MLHHTKITNGIPILLGLAVLLTLGSLRLHAEGNKSSWKMVEDKAKDAEKQAKAQAEKEKKNAEKQAKAQAEKEKKNAEKQAKAQAEKEKKKAEKQAKGNKGKGTKGKGQKAEDMKTELDVEGPKPKGWVWWGKWKKKRWNAEMERAKNAVSKAAGDQAEQAQQILMSMAAKGKEVNDIRKARKMVLEALKKKTPLDAILEAEKIAQKGAGGHVPMGK